MGHHGEGRLSGRQVQFTASKVEKEKGYNITLNISEWLGIDMTDHQDTLLAVHKQSMSMNRKTF